MCLLGHDHVTHDRRGEQGESLDPVVMHRSELFDVFLVLFRISLTELDGVPRFEVAVPRAETEEFEFVRDET